MSGCVLIFQNNHLWHSKKGNQNNSEGLNNHQRHAKQQFSQKAVIYQKKQENIRTSGQASGIHYQQFRMRNCSKNNMF